MATPLSIYILTMNSERRLGQVLDQASQVADELIIIDSGSIDKTAEIISHYSAVTIYRKLDNFRDQRIFAENACTNNWVLALDSDEVLSDDLIIEINRLKHDDFRGITIDWPDGFSIRRDWYFLDRQIRNFYPVKTPEYIVRLFRKDKISTHGSRIIHESLQLHNCRIENIDKPILHFSCDSVDDLYGKLNLYTRLSAEDMHSRGEHANWWKIYVYPWLIWAKWYLIYGSWRDGEFGVILSRYIRTTVYIKYIKLKYITKSGSLLKP